MAFIEQVTKAVQTANWRKGYGDVVSCRVFMDGKVSVTIRRPFMRDTVRTGRVHTGRVYFAGTSAKIG